MNLCFKLLPWHPPPGESCRSPRMSSFVAEFHMSLPWKHESAAECHVFITPAAADVRGWPLRLSLGFCPRFFVCLFLLSYTFFLHSSPSLFSSLLPFPLPFYQPHSVSLLYPSTVNLFHLRPSSSLSLNLWPAYQLGVAFCSTSNVKWLSINGGQRGKKTQVPLPPSLGTNTSQKEETGKAVVTSSSGWEKWNRIQ